MMGSPRMFYHPRLNRGFTLLEVLVVVAIIALLVAILVPSLQSAREEARAAVCAAHQKECLQGCIIQILERQMRRERVSTNFGWAVFTLKTIRGETGVFTCPNDPDPKPIPAMHMTVPDSAYGPGGVTSTDGIFNRWKRISDTKWQTDIQDVVDVDNFGLDASSNPNDIDLLLEYNVDKGATSAVVKVAGYESGLDFVVSNYKGQTIWPSAAGAVGQQTPAPILWMSYSANAPAGLTNVKGNPILLAEGGKPGLFPFDLVKRSGAIGYPKDKPIAKALRFRHGAKVPAQSAAAGGWNSLTGWDYVGLGRGGAAAPDGVTGIAIDMRYEPRERMNCGFYDGHVERLYYKKLIFDPASPSVPQIWRGSGNLNYLTYQ